MSPRSVLVGGEDLSGLINDSRPMRSGNFGPACAASSSRRLAIKETHVVAASPHMPGSGKSLALVSTSRISPIS